jgi:predicted metal-dependent phosphotriesterase family hydrolase
MRGFIILMLISLTGCSMRSLVTPATTVGGAALGGVVGPGGAALGAGVGYAGGKIYELTDANEELVDSITHGDVQGLVKAGLAQHQTGFEKFTSTVKKILIGAAVLLAGYLAIPIFIAKRTAQNCSKTEAIKHQTRAPFPPKPSTPK